MPAEDRTEPATPKKRKELKRRGRIHRSQDLGSVAVFVGVLLCLHATGGASADHLRLYLRSSLARLGERQTLTANDLVLLFGEVALIAFHALWPIVLTAMLLGILVNGAQTGFSVGSRALVPDFTRINPLAGLQRLTSGRSLVELAKSALKCIIVLGIAWRTISADYPSLVMTMRQDVATALGAVGETVYRLALRTTLFLFVVAVADYLYGRWSFERSIRMTKQEVKEESKAQEASPLMRSRMRTRLRQLLRRAMLSKVPQADAIVTNPTHYAVALKYDAATMQAPVVLAKGAGCIAARIRQIGGENGVPIVENPPLARALFRQVEVGQEVPPEFYVAVAEVLAYVYQIDRRRRSGLSYAAA